MRIPPPAAASIDDPLSQWWDAYAACMTARADPVATARWRPIARHHAAQRLAAANRELHVAYRTLRPAVVQQIVDCARVKFMPNDSRLFWQKPLVEDLEQTWKQSVPPGAPTPSPDEFLASIFAQSTLAVVQDDLETVREAATRYPPEVLDLLGSLSYIGRPNQVLIPEDDPPPWCIPAGYDRVGAFLSSSAAVLPRPISVWRGEHADKERFPGFTRTAQNAKPGDVLNRGHNHGILSTSLSPVVAARTEFTHVFPGQQPPALDGWLLRITTDRVLYAGSRAELLHSHLDGLADELEAFIHTPRLQVCRVFEALVRSGRGERRIKVIDAGPV